LFFLIFAVIALLQFTFGLYCKYWLIRELQPLQPLDKDIDIFYDAFIKGKERNKKI